MSCCGTILLHGRPDGKDWLDLHGHAQGELLGLRKSEVNLAIGLITVRRSHARDTTKGRRDQAVPIASEIVPYLEHAGQSITDGDCLPKGGWLDDVTGDTVRGCPPFGARPRWDRDRVQTRLSP
jgi:hypothetical protein